MRKLVTGLLGLSLGAVFFGAALAHKGATGIVKERMDSMTVLSRQMKTLGAMFQGKIKFSKTRVVSAGGVIVKHGTKIRTLFPKGSDHKPTRALPLIWQENDHFNTLGQQMIDAGKKLSAEAEKANSIGDLKPYILKVGATCKACHKKYRAPEK